MPFLNPWRTDDRKQYWAEEQERRRNLSPWRRWVEDWWPTTALGLFALMWFLIFPGIWFIGLYQLGKWIFG